MIKIIEIWDCDKDGMQELNNLIAEGWEVVSSGMNCAPHEEGAMSHLFHLKK